MINQEPEIMTDIKNESSQLTADELATRLDEAQRTIGRLCYLLCSAVGCIELDMFIDEIAPENIEGYFEWRAAVHERADNYYEEIINKLPREYMSSVEDVGLPQQDSNEVEV